MKFWKTLLFLTALIACSNGKPPNPSLTYLIASITLHDYEHTVFHQFINAEEDGEAPLKEEPAEPKKTLPEGVVMPGFSAEDEKAIDAGKESFAFQAEVNRLMDIIINSLCKFDCSALACIRLMTKPVIRR
jgi:hypothetical protein